MVLEWPTIDGESPVDKIDFTSSLEFLSIIEHVKFSENPPGPSGKAKYEPLTDSEQVP